LSIIILTGWLSSESSTAHNAREATLADPEAEPWIVHNGLIHLQDGEWKGYRDRDGDFEARFNSEAGQADRAHLFGDEQASVVREGLEAGRQEAEQAEGEGEHEEHHHQATARGSTRRQFNLHFQSAPNDPLLIKSITITPATLCTSRTQSRRTTREWPTKPTAYY